MQMTDTRGRFILEKRRLTTVPMKFDLHLEGDKGSYAGQSTAVGKFTPAEGPLTAAGTHQAARVSD